MEHDTPEIDTNPEKPRKRTQEDKNALVFLFFVTLWSGIVSVVAFGILLDLIGFV